MHIINKEGPYAPVKNFWFPHDTVAYKGTFLFNITAI
jgi:hypothetical protein